MTWTCPACGLDQALEVKECPRCGIVVAKFSDKGRGGFARKSIGANWQAETESSTQNAWVIIVATVILCLIAGGALLKWTLDKRSDEIKLAQAPEKEAGGLKKFTYENLQAEVVAVSRKQPVIIEFYSPN